MTKQLGNPWQSCYRQ